MGQGEAKSHRYVFPISSTIYKWSCMTVLTLYCVSTSIFFFLQICVQYCIDVDAVVEMNSIQFNTVRTIEWSWAGHINRLKDDDGLGGHYYDKKRRQGRPAKRWRDDLGIYWSDTIWQRTAQYRLLRPSPDHGTLRLPNDDDDHKYMRGLKRGSAYKRVYMLSKHEDNAGHITSNVFPVHDVLNEKGLIRGLCSVFTV